MFNIPKLCFKLYLCLLFFLKKSYFSRNRKCARNNVSSTFDLRVETKPVDKAYNNFAVTGEPGNAKWWRKDNFNWKSSIRYILTNPKLFLCSLLMLIHDPHHIINVILVTSFIQYTVWWWWQKCYFCRANTFIKSHRKNPLEIGKKSFFFCFRVCFFNKLQVFGPGRLHVCDGFLLFLCKLRIYMKSSRWEYWINVLARRKLFFALSLF